MSGKFLIKNGGGGNSPEHQITAIKRQLCTTRRKLIGGLSAIIATQSCPAVLTRSLLAARQIFLGRGGGGDAPVLPDGAVALDYVDCVGGQLGVEVYGLIPSEGTDFFCMATPNPTAIICIFGCGGAWVGHQSSLILTSSNGSTGMTVVDGSWNEYSIVDGKVCLNGTASSITTSIIGKTNNMCFGGYNGGGSFSWRGKIGHFWAIRDGEKIADVYPCLHDGKYGFCDIVSSSFLREGNFPSGGYLT